MIRADAFSAAYALLALDLAARELLLFVMFWFIIGALDEFAIDAIWLRLRWQGGATTPVWHVPLATATGLPGRLSGRIAVFMPAWSEADVIGTTISHLLRTWPQPELRLYIGCYRNDSLTVVAAASAAARDPRVRIVIHDRARPSTKADCLNRLHEALCADEARLGQRFRAVVFHDAEDMVHRLALPAIDRALDSAEFVQLPVRPEPMPSSRWISGHYCDEFAESHAKALIVRQALGAGLPSAGVGCGIARGMLDLLVAQRRAEGEAGPFAADALTEDYEMGLVIARLGGRGRFLRLRDGDGELIATRSLFPGELVAAVRQKTRWIHGIALQGWDRLGWASRPVEVWMALRDRRGPLIALVLAAAYLLLVVDFIRAIAHARTGIPAVGPDPVMRVLVLAGFFSLCWRALLRGLFTGREYGMAEGLRAVLRIPVANVITIMAGRRAVLAYLRTLAGAPVSWDKTAHRQHAVQFAVPRVAAVAIAVAQAQEPSASCDPVRPARAEQVPA